MTKARLFYRSSLEEPEKYVDVPLDNIEQVTAANNGYYRMIVKYNTKRDYYPEFITKLKFI